MSEFLSRILTTTRQDVATRKLEWPLAGLREAVLSGPRSSRSLIGAVREPGISVIAEVKRASPSKGDIRPGLDVREVVAAYQQAGASAVSVLTEERFFKGSLEDLKTARSACDLPIIRKDFVVDPYQIWEAAAAGADAILLIVAALRPKELQELYGEASLAGLECLVEVHDRAELETALGIGVALLGINNRNLKNFKVHLETTLNLIEFVPHEVPVVSESGIGSREDVRRLEAAGASAILIGETLMRSHDPGKKLSELLGV